MWYAFISFTEISKKNLHLIEVEPQLIWFPYFLFPKILISIFQFPYFSFHISVSVFQFPYFSFHISVSIFQYPYFSFHISVSIYFEIHRCKPHTNQDKTELPLGVKTSDVEIRIRQATMSADKMYMIRYSWSRIRSSINDDHINAKRNR